MKRRRLWLLSAFVVAMILIWFLWPGPKNIPASPLPSPNGYDDFVKAGQLLADSSGDYARMTKDELRALISTNQESLRLARLGLGRDSQVPTENSSAYMDSHLTNLGAIKHLAQVLSAEGRLAEAEERFDESVKIQLEVMHLGRAAVRGGLIIDKLVGLAVENIGLAGLERVVYQLDTASGQKTIRSVEEMDAHSDGAAEYIKRSRQVEKAAYGLTAWIQAAWTYRSLRPFRGADQKFAARLVRTDIRRRQLLLSLAIRVYELEHGKRPLRAEDLVPSVLRAVPKDPETGTNLVLSPAP